MNPIPITIITGFLGAGKTTLMNNLINAMPDTRFGLIINEFGAIGIDSQLVEKQEEEMIELTAGCMCCSIRDDIVKSVSQLVGSGSVDYILVETSGVAIPRPIIQTLMLMNEEQPDIKARLDSVLCAIDPTSFQIRKDTFLTGIEQLRYSNIALLTKSDVVTKDEKEQVLDFFRAINPEIPAVEIQKDMPIPIDLVMQTGFFDNRAFAKKDASDTAETTHPESFETISFQTEEIFDPKKLSDWDKLSFPKNAIRAKGVVRVSTKQGVTPFVYQRVGAVSDLYPVPKTSTIDTSFSRIVLIGNNLSEEELKTSLEDCTIKNDTGLK